MNNFFRTRYPQGPTDEASYLEVHGIIMNPTVKDSIGLYRGQYQSCNLYIPNNSYSPYICVSTDLTEKDGF